MGKRHSFTNTPIPKGETTVIEKCIKEGCTILGIRNLSGSIVHINPRDNTPIYNGYRLPCTGKDKNNLTERIKAINHPQLEIITKAIEKFKQITVLVREPEPILTKTGLTQEEATLKDAITIIRLMYEDIIKNKIHTHSRRIAETFLHSQNYTEVVKNIESKTT